MHVHVEIGYTLLSMLGLFGYVSALIRKSVKVIEIRASHEGLPRSGILMFYMSK